MKCNIRARNIKLMRSDDSGGLLNYLDDGAVGFEEYAGFPSRYATFWFDRTTGLIAEFTDRNPQMGNPNIFASQVDIVDARHIGPNYLIHTKRRLNFNRNVSEVAERNVRDSIIEYNQALWFEWESDHLVIEMPADLGLDPNDSSKSQTSTIHSA